MTNRGTKLEQAEEALERARVALERNLGTITEPDWRRDGRALRGARERAPESELEMSANAAEKALPLDWDEWRNEWSDWLQRNQGDMHYVSRSPFKGKNFLADEILGVWRVNGRTVELSEVVFPNLEDRDPDTGRLLEGYKRRIGVTFEDDTNVVDSFAQLESVLGL